MREILVKTEEFKDSPLGKIPKDWGVLKIATFASIKYGINDAIDQTLESGIPTITLPCVKSSGELVLDKEVLGLTSRHKVYPDDVLQHGDLLFNWRNGSQDHLGKTAYFKASGEYTHVGFLLRIRTNPEMCNSRYLWWRLCYMKAQGFFLKAKSQVNNTFNSAELAAVNVIIPPIHEQQCIVEILDAVDEAIAHTTTLIAKLKQMKAGLLHDLLTRGLDENGELRDAIAHPEQFKDSPLGQIPKDWEIRTCESVCREIVVGIVIKPSQYYQSSGVPALRSANVREAGLNPSDLVFISEQSNRLLVKSMIRTGDVLTVRTGYPGTSCVVPPEFNGANCVDIIISRPGAEIESAFLATWINSDFGKGQVLRVQGGLAQQHFNVGELQKLLIAKPSIEEQRAIQTRIEAYDTRIRAEEAYREKLKLQKQGLMHDLLTGKVRVNQIKI